MPSDDVSDDVVLWPANCRDESHRTKWVDWGDVIECAHADHEEVVA
jgi:hypothetical protein